MQVEVDLTMKMKTGIVLSWILMGSIAISSIACDECEVGEPPWCDGDKLNYCESGGGIVGDFLSPDRIEPRDCAVTCKDVEQDDGSTRGYCVLSEEPCSWSGTKCMGSLVTKCPYDIGYPVKEEECVSDRPFCVATYGIALCAYENTFCSPAGVRKCWSKDPADYLICSSGAWRYKRTCEPFRTQCVQISSEEIDCQE